jgi:diacylglycerol kinase family enzyme
MIEGVFDPAVWLIVVNPASGAGRAARFRPRLLAALGRAGLAFRCVESAGAGDCLRSAATARSTSS